MWVSLRKYAFPSISKVPYAFIFRMKHSRYLHLFLPYIFPFHPPFCRSCIFVSLCVSQLSFFICLDKYLFCSHSIFLSRHGHAQTHALTHAHTQARTPLALLLFKHKKKRLTHKWISVSLFTNWIRDEFIQNVCKVSERQNILTAIAGFWKHSRTRHRLFEFWTRCNASNVTWIACFLQSSSLYVCGHS